jgi:mercuric ion transport protein
MSVMNDGKLRSASLGGAVVAAVTASICCVGPLVFALLGLGGAGVLVKLEPLRPYMTVLTIGLLCAGFWVTYRPPAAASTANGVACDCEKPTVNKMGRVALWGTTALVGIILAFPYLTPYLFPE